MKPLIVLLVSFALALIATQCITGGWHWQQPARIALSIMLLFTAMGHFTYTQGMALMLPVAIPFKTALVYITGVIEIAAALLLLHPASTTVTGWFLIVFFILLLPANVYAALHHVNYQTGNADGPGLRYLWFRIPMQLFLILWTYAATVTHP